MIVTTKRLTLATAWLSGGLIFVETSAVENARECVFIFEDPHGDERVITTTFFRNDEIQRYLESRLALARSLTLAKASPSKRCTILPTRGTR
jgi:hypothetical protein